MNEQSFSRRLAEERRARGCTQKQVAEALGISDRTYSKWETGENEMDVASLCRLAEFYGVSPAAFFPAEETKPEGVRDALGTLPPGEAARRWFTLHRDALRGMNDALWRHYADHPEDYFKALPGLTPPEGAESDVTTFLAPDLLALIVSGEDLNLSLLLEPNAQRWRWLTAEEELLRPIFQALAMPGAIPCLAFLFSRRPDTLFSAGYVASRAGVPEAEAEAALAESAKQGLVISAAALRKGREVRLYRPQLRVPLLGILALAKCLYRRPGSGHTAGAANGWLDMEGGNGNDAG